MSQTVLILGGTREAAALARQLVADHPDRRVITSLAGRTLEPEPVAGELRVGGFGGPDGLADFIRRENVTRLIDATHPYARQISQNAREAAMLSGVPLDIRTRPPWQKQPGDRWIDVASETAAADAVPSGARVFLSLGRQHLAPFAKRDDLFFLLRMVDAPATPPPLTDQTLIIGKPGSALAETVLLRDHGITHVVSRNAGGTGAYGKIEAARKLRLPVIMIGR